MRINIYHQLNGFYSFVFDNQDKGIKPQHISLYLFLINQNNRNNWATWFKSPYDLAMYGACIGSKKTYYDCLSDLQEWKLISYKKGINNWKAPMVRIEVLKRTSTIPLSEQVEEPEHIQQLTQLAMQQPTHILIPVINNFKLITNNISEILKWLEKKDKPTIKKDESEYSDFQNMKIFFIDYFEKDGSRGKYHFDGADGAALKQLEKKISKDLQDGAEILEFWEVFLTNLPTWYQNNLSLKVINSKYNEIKSSILSSGSNDKHSKAREEAYRIFAETSK